jgi:amino acid permease
MKFGIVLTLLASGAALTAAAVTPPPTTARTLRGGAAFKRPNVKNIGRKGGAAVTAAPPKNPVVGGGTATIPNEIFNLVKAVVGVGVLSLPAGIAAFGNNPGALVPALSLIAFIGILSGYGFAVIGKVCAYTGATSYREAWSKSVGPSTSWIPAWSTTLKTFVACLAFSMVLADTFASLLGTTERTKALLGVTAMLLPLCLMKSLAALAPFSLLGVIGMMFTALAMTVRYLDGSYAMPNGPLLSQVPQILKPSFGDRGMTSVFSPSSLILTCMLSTAYMAHFNAPKVSYMHSRTVSCTICCIIGVNVNVNANVYARTMSALYCFRR